MGSGAKIIYLTHKNVQYISCLIVILLIQNRVQCELQNEDETLIDELISRLSLRFFYLDTNFDGTNIKNPLVGYVDFSLNESINPAVTKYT